MAVELNSDWDFVLDDYDLLGIDDEEVIAERWVEDNEAFYLSQKCTRNGRTKRRDFWDT
jgi:hypothetical protein